MPFASQPAILRADSIFFDHQSTALAPWCKQLLVVLGTIDVAVFLHVSHREWDRLEAVIAAQMVLVPGLIKGIHSPFMGMNGSFAASTQFDTLWPPNFH